MYRTFKALSPALIALMLSAPASASDDLRGQVVRILDGDTVELKTLPADVLVTEAPIRVRLNGIDAPEKKQPYGQRSKQYLADMVGGKWVTMAMIAITAAWGTF